MNGFDSVHIINDTTDSARFPVVMVVADVALHLVVRVRSRINPDGSMAHLVPSRSGKRPHEVSVTWCTCIRKAYHRHEDCWHQQIAAFVAATLRQDCQDIIAMLHGPKSYGDTRALADRMLARMEISEMTARAVVARQGSTVVVREVAA